MTMAQRVRPKSSRWQITLKARFTLEEKSRRPDSPWRACKLRSDRSYHS